LTALCVCMISCCTVYDEPLYSCVCTMTVITTAYCVLWFIVIKLFGDILPARHCDMCVMMRPVESAILVGQCFLKVYFFKKPSLALLETWASFAEVRRSNLPEQKKIGRTKILRKNAIHTKSHQKDYTVLQKELRLTKSLTRKCSKFGFWDQNLLLHKLCCVVVTHLGQKFSEKKT